MNTKFIILLLFVFTIFASSCEHKNDITETKVICFDTEILPIFKNNCATCHGNDRTEKDLKYIDYSSIMKTIKAGDVNGSKAYKSIINIVGEEAMPPDAPLSQNQRTLIRLWIEQGAKETICYDSCNNYSYSEVISKIITNNCLSCHSGTSPSGNVSLTNFNEVKAIADDGRFVNVINASNGKPQMPPSGSLTSCEKDQIENWISNGAANDK